MGMGVVGEWGHGEGISPLVLAAPLIMAGAHITRPRRAHPPALWAAIRVDQYRSFGVGGSGSGRRRACRCSAAGAVPTPSTRTSGRGGAAGCGGRPHSAQACAAALPLVGAVGPPHLGMHAGFAPSVRDLGDDRVRFLTADGWHWHSAVGARTSRPHLTGPLRAYAAIRLVLATMGPS